MAKKKSTKTLSAETEQVIATQVQVEKVEEMPQVETKEVEQVINEVAEVKVVEQPQPKVQEVVKKETPKRFIPTAKTIATISKPTSQEPKNKQRLDFTFFWNGQTVD